MTRVHTPRQNAKEASDDIDRKIIKCSEDKSLERELRALGKQLVEAKTEADVKKAEHEKKRHEMNKARLDELTESQEARRQLACHDPVHDITKSNFDNTKSREHACGAPANWFGEMGAAALAAALVARSRLPMHAPKRGLEHLDVSHNNIGERGATAVCGTAGVGRGIIC
jgi:hypothetical protein